MMNLMVCSVMPPLKIIKINIYNNYMDNLQNPIVIGILAAILTYTVLYIKRQYYDSDKEGHIPLFLPVLIGLISWFVCGKYLGSCYDPGFDVTDVRGLNEEMMLRGMADF